jgi:uncharacterized repeat protein (TIGR03803 family)
MRRGANAAKRASAVIVLCALFALGSPAQTFTTLFTFDGRNGLDPMAGLVQATNGDLYGTTLEGGSCPSNPTGCGTVFKITPNGTLTTLYSFCSLANCADGYEPEAGLVQATNGDLYGTIGAGGANGTGTVFQITLSGDLTTLYSFCAQGVYPDCSDGWGPGAGLVQATNGELYGTTASGGANNGGTVFKITPSGTLTTLYSFCSLAKCADGERPYAGLVKASNGDLYGTTSGGGRAYGDGTVFKISPSGTLTTLYSFCSLANCADGKKPYAGLVQATNGDFFGTTSYGGAHSFGTVYKITPSGTLTTLYKFCALANCADGSVPEGLVQATNGDLFGTTVVGGAHGGGTIFQITPSGVLTTLYSFCSLANCADGKGPYGGLVQATNGDFYGTTYDGGNSICALGCGTVFSLSLGLGPFVESLPAAGKLGSRVKILGTDLTGATSVTFNGTAAVFTVTSPTLIATTVPTGASSGSIQVVTPSGTLSSDVPFRVLP